MKKIFYIIASAIVALGAVACQNDSEEGIKPENKGEGVSFTAEIADLTRVAVLDSDDANYDKKLAWEGNETIVANYDSKKWEFTNTPEAPKTFTCKAEGAEVLLGKAIGLAYNQDNNYEAHANGSAQTIILSGQTTDFGTVPVVFTLNGGGLIFHFTCAEETVIKWYGTDDNIGYYNGWGKEHTFAAGEHYISVQGGSSVEGGDLNMTLEAWVDGVKIKSASRTFDAGKIYNLGEIKKPYHVYVLPQPNSSISKWAKVNLYTWVTDGIGLTWPGEDITSNTTEINGYTYYVYEYPTEYNDLTVNVIANNGSGTQTVDIELGKLDKDYYVVLYTTSKYEVHTSAPAAGSIEAAATVVDPKPGVVSVYLNTTWGWSDWALYGFGGAGNWGDYNTWPGKAMYEQVIDGITYKAWDIPASCIGQEGTQIILTGKEWGEDRQTTDTPVTFTSGKDLFFQLVWTTQSELQAIASPY